MKNIVGNVWEWTDDWWTTNHESKDKHVISITFSQ